MEIVTRSGYYLLIFLVVLIALYISPIGMSLEPDSYFHFAISKLTLEQGLVRSLPQADNIGWVSYFPDKEFLFHQFTALAFYLGGESGVHIACLMLASLIVVMIVINGEQFCSKPLALGITLLVLLNYSFTSRLFLIRPHLAGIFFFLVILLGLLKSNKTILALGSFLFPLFYHAFFMPLMLLGIFGLVEKGKNYRFLFLFSVFPMLTGILINPYFPTNIFMSWEVIKIAFSVNHSLNSGDEAKSLPFLATLIRSGAYLIMTVLLATQIKDIYKKSSRATALLLIVIVLHILFFISPRTIEYLVPMFAILVCSIVPLFKDRIESFSVLLCSILLAFNIQYLGYFTIPEKFWSSRAKEMQHLISQIPDSNNKKVFNCEWETGSYLLYYKPSLKFVDLLDPNFIYLQNIELGKLRDKMVNFPSSHIYDTLVNIFKADYIMCFAPNFLKTIEADPRFIKVAESSQAPITKIYRVTKP
jgi:hypothetical protein